MPPMPLQPLSIRTLTPAPQPKTPAPRPKTPVPQPKTPAPQPKTPVPRSRALATISNEQGPGPRRPPHPLEIKALDAQIHYIFQEWLQHAQSLPNSPELGATELYQQMTCRIAILGAITYEFNWVISEFCKINGAEYLIGRPVSSDPTVHIKIPIDDVETLCMMWAAYTEKFRKKFNETWGSPKQGAVLMKEELTRLLHLSLAMEKIHVKNLTKKGSNKKVEREGGIARDGDANTEAAIKVGQILHQKLERTRYRILNSNFIAEFEAKYQWTPLAAAEGQRTINGNFKTGITRNVRKEFEFDNHEFRKARGDDDYEELDMNDMRYLRPFNDVHEPSRIQSPLNYPPQPSPPLEQAMPLPSSPIAVKHAGSSIHTTSTSNSIGALATLRSFFTRSSTKSNATAVPLPPVRHHVQTTCPLSAMQLAPAALHSQTPRKLKKCVSTPALKEQKSREANKSNKAQMIGGGPQRLGVVQYQIAETPRTPRTRMLTPRPSTPAFITRPRPSMDEVGKRPDFRVLRCPSPNTPTSFNRDFRFPMPPKQQQEQTLVSQAGVLRPKNSFIYDNGRRVTEIPKGEEDEYMRKHAYMGEFF